MITVRNKSNMHEMDCPCCISLLIYDDSDIQELYHGRGIVCPNCNSDIYLEEYKPMEFPMSFSHCKAKMDYIELNDEIQNAINNVVEYLKKSRPDEYYYYIAYRDYFIVGFKMEDSIELFVTKDYYKDTLDSSEY